MPEWKSLAGEIDKGYSAMSGSGRTVGWSTAARCGKGSHKQEGTSLSDKFVGISWSRTKKLKQQEVSRDENRAPSAPLRGGEAGMGGLV